MQVKSSVASLTSILMTGTTDTPTAGRARKRPADRRDRILAAAARNFASVGFHETRLNVIAEEAGVSAPALYRHFSGKYELFATALIDLAGRLTAAADAVPTGDDPRQEISAVLRALAVTALDNRESGNIYRREPRLLNDEDWRALSALSGTWRARLCTLLQRLRPDLSYGDGRLLVTAAASIIASPVTHRVALPRKTALAVLCGTAGAVLDLDLPAPAPSAGGEAGLVPLGRREAVLTESIRLFARHGFHEVTLEQIGAAAGLPPSGVYRHFQSKSAILAAALWRASERTTGAITEGLAQATTPHEALIALAGEYSALCVDDRAIMTVYLRDMNALDAADQRSLRRQQRRNVDEWATWLQHARPEVSSATARYLVHAALSVATDLTISYRDADADTVAVLVAAVLTGDP